MSTVKQEAIEIIKERLIPESVQDTLKIKSVSHSLFDYINKYDLETKNLVIRVDAEYQGNSLRIYYFAGLSYKGLLEFNSVIILDEALIEDISGFIDMTNDVLWIDDTLKDKQPQYIRELKDIFMEELQDKLTYNDLIEIGHELDNIKYINFHIRVDRENIKDSDIESVQEFVMLLKSVKTRKEQ